MLNDLIKNFEKIKEDVTTAQEQNKDFVNKFENPQRTVAYPNDLILGRIAILTFF